MSLKNWLSAYGACCLILSAASAFGETAPEEIKLGVADMGQLLAGYWRTPRVQHVVERRKVSEAYRQKQMDIVQLERELENQRFWFFSRRNESEQLQQMRDELEALARKEAKKELEQEKQAVETLTAEIKKAAETAAARNQLSVVFDANNPHLLYFNMSGDSGSDITQEVLETMNSTGFGGVTE